MLRMHYLGVPLITSIIMFVPSKYSLRSYDSTIPTSFPTRPPQLWPVSVWNVIRSCWVIARWIHPDIIVKSIAMFNPVLYHVINLDRKQIRKNSIRVVYLIPLNCVSIGWLTRYPSFLNKILRKLFYPSLPCRVLLLLVQGSGLQHGTTSECLRCWRSHRALCKV